MDATASRADSEHLRLEFERVASLSQGAAEQLLPAALSFDANGDEICVTEQRESCLHLLNAEGVEHFRTLNLAGLRTPQDGCIAADGSLYCLDLDQDGRGLRIRRLNLLGEPVEFAAEAPSTSWSPGHLALDVDGRLISLDPVSGLLACHDSDSGALVWSVAIFDGNIFDLGFGRPFCAPDGRIFVPGGETHMVHVYDRDGRLQSSFGEFGTGPGGLVFPVGVAQASGGRLLVLDRMRHKILVFDSSFQYVTELGQAGIWPGRLYHPLAIAVTGDDRVIVSQGFESRVQVFALLTQGRG